MAKERIDQHKKALNNYGKWAGIRYLRNQGVPFDEAYYALFDRLPGSGKQDTQY